jgi:hypothetical protein
VNHLITYGKTDVLESAEMTMDAGLKGVAEHYLVFCYQAPCAEQPTPHLFPFVFTLDLHGLTRSWTIGNVSAC